MQNLLDPLSFGFRSILIVFPTSAAREAKAKIDAFNPGLPYWMNKSLVWVDKGHVTMQRQNQQLIWPLLVILSWRPRGPNMPLSDGRAPFEIFPWLRAFKLIA